VEEKNFVIEPDSLSPYASDPVAALRRIAFLMERRLEDTYKVQAFRKAASAILPLPIEEIHRRVAYGTLTQIAGVGASTAAVVTQAVEGQVPDRLVAAETTYGGPLAATSGPALAALRGDLHSHSDWSDGGSPIQEMAMTAHELGREYLALTDHSPRLRVANGLSAERLRKQLDIVDAINTHMDGFMLLKGIEVDILDDGSLDQSEEMLELLDVRVASVHSKLAMDKAAMTKRMLTAVTTTRMNVLGHCTGRLVGGGRGRRPESQFDARAVFDACAEHNVAVEINSRPERRDPPTRLLEMARDAGCLFSIDSDAHAPGQLDFPQLGCERADAAGIEPERIVNTWPLEELLAWANPVR
jgi:putative hydrolase